MCDPVSLAIMTFAASAASGLMAYKSQKEQYAEKQRQRAENEANAKTAAINKWESINTRVSQEGALATQKKFESNIETAQAVATATTAAGEGGVSGLSVNALLGDLYAKRGRHSSAVDSNLQMTRSYLEGEMDVAGTNAQSQINSLPIPEKPSFAATLVNIFGSAVGSYGGYKQQTA